MTGAAFRMTEVRLFRKLTKRKKKIHKILLLVVL